MRVSGKKEIFYIVLLVVIALISCGCSGEGIGGTAPGGDNTGGTTSSKVQLSGTIAAPSGKPGVAMVLRSAATGSVSEVWAIPIAKMQGANIDSVNVMLRKTTTPDASGYFSFDLEKSMTLAEIAAKVPTMDTGGMSMDTVFDVDWLLVEMAGSDPLSVVELKGDSTYDGMVSIPLSEYNADTISLGNISAADGAATLSVSGIASDLSLSSADLASITRSDDMLAAITDIIRNCDLDTNKCLKAQQSFAFSGDYTQLTHRINYSIADFYEGYQFYFDLSQYYDSGDFDGICPAAGSATVEYQLTPPGVISIDTGTYDQYTPLTTGVTNTVTLSDLNNGAYTQCFKNGASVYLRKDNSTSEWMLQFIASSTLPTTMPVGDWVLTRKGNGESGYTEVGRFDFSLAKPVDDAGWPIVYVPAIRFETDGTAENGLTALHVKWYQYVGNGYEEVTDGALLDSLMGGFSISMDDFTGLGDNNRRSVQQNNFSFSTREIDVHDPDGLGPFYYNYSSEDKYSLDYVSANYNYGGQSFRFYWNRQ
jgi:hypothetical protein